MSQRLSGKVALVTGASAGTALTIVGDAREESTARDAVALATSKAGGLDILVNNAGVGNYKNLVDTSADDYDEMMDSNMSRCEPWPNLSPNP